MIVNLIPTDLKNYLESHNKRTFKTKQAGPFEIIELKDLELHLIPTDIDNAEFFENHDVIYGNKENPHHEEMGCRL